jgi:hypothetical protein
MRFYDEITTALQRAGVAYTDEGHGGLRVGRGLQVWTDSRTVSVRTVLSESATHEKTNHASHRFRGRRWLRRLVRFVVTGDCSTCDADDLTADL